MQFGTITELGIALADLVEAHNEWSRKTFGSDEERGPLGPLKHLEKEAVEAQVWGKYPEDKEAFAEEMADCFLLVLDAARRGGIKPMQLIEAAQAKVKKNRSRQWPKTSADEPVEHIREAP